MRVHPPFHSGLYKEEKKKNFQVVVKGQIKTVPFLVSTYSKTTILLNTVGGRSVASLKFDEVESGAAPIETKQLQSAPRTLDGKLQVAVLKRLPEKHPSGYFMLRSVAVDVPVTKRLLAGKPPAAPAPPAAPTPKNRLPIVYEGVDNSIAAQQARKRAMKNVEEDIFDYAINGSISERHLKAGWKAHAKTDKVREAFYDHQEELYHKKLIEPKHRFID